MLRNNNYKPFAIPKNSNHDLIYQAGIRQDRKTLDEVLENCCIDVLDTTYMPPVTLLAERGLDNAVDFLREHYGASLKWIVFGYAKSGNLNKCLGILEQNPDQQRFLLRELVYGLVICGGEKIRAECQKIKSTHHSRGAFDALSRVLIRTNQEIKFARELVQRHPQDRFMLIKYFGLGWGYAGFHPGDIGIDVPPDYQDIFHGSLFYGYVMGRHETLVNEVLDNETPQNIKYITTAIRGYAIRDFTPEVNRLLKKFNSLYLMLLPEVIVGYASSNSLDNLNKLLINNLMPAHGFIDSLIDGFASGGHLFEMNTLINQQAAENQDELLELSIYRLSFCGHLSHVKQLIKKYPNLAVEAISGFTMHNDMAAIQKVVMDNLPKYFTIISRMINQYALENNCDRVFELLRAHGNDFTNLFTDAVVSFIYNKHSASYRQLLDNFGLADDDYMKKVVAYNLAKGHHIEVTDQYFKETRTMKVVNKMAEAFIEDNFFSQINYLLSRFKKVRNRPTDVVKDHRPDLIKLMARHVKDRYVDEVEALIHLAHIPAKQFRHDFANALQPLNPDTNYSRVIKRADKINEVISREKLSFNQCVAWLSGDVQIFLLQGIQLVDQSNQQTDGTKTCQITKDLYFIILSYLVMLDKQKVNEVGFRMHAFFQPKRLNTTSEQENIPPETSDRSNKKPGYSNQLLSKNVTVYRPKSLSESNRNPVAYMR